MMEVFFNMKKIRFDKIDELFTKERINIVNNEVTLYINLESILKHLMNDVLDKYLRIQNERKIFEIIANIINLAAHYRLYFSSRKISSKIYLYIQHPFNPEYKNRKYNPEYRMVYKHKYHTNLNNFIIFDNFESAIPLTKTILDYIEGVHLIESGIIENSVIPYVIGKDKKTTNIILTSDPYDMQYGSLGYYILYPRQDESRLITPKTTMVNFSHIYKVNTGNMTSKQLPFLLSISGDNDRNIYGIKGVGKARAVKLLCSAIDHGAIAPDTDNIHLLLPIVKKQFVKDIENNFKCTDILSQYKDLTEKDIYSIESQCVDKFDNVSLKELNDEYFGEYPIMLDALTSRPNINRPKVIY